MMINSIELDWKVPWGIISDAHGNPFGLDTCIRKLIELGAKHLFFLGDAIGYLPMEMLVFESLKKYNVICITGNHEAMLFDFLPLDIVKEKVYGIEAVRKRLSNDLSDWIKTWPKMRVLTDGKVEDKICLVHGGFLDPWQQYIYSNSELSEFFSCGYRAVFFGQTHKPFIKCVNKTLVVNVGSCGLPRDVGNLASCVLYDPVSNNAEIHRIKFDVDLVLSEAKKIHIVHEGVERCLRRI